MLTVHGFAPSATVKVTGRATFSENIESRVDELWLERQRNGGKLFNGRILSALQVDAQGIETQEVEYRHLLAQRAHPELFAILKLRPVAVSGLLECRGGVVFGRRSGSVTEAQGLWELVPSGGLGAGAGVVGATVDYRGQLLAELNEELGIGADAVLDIRPLCLVEDLDSHVLDIGLAMSCHHTAEEVRRSHCEAGSREYDELLIVPHAELRAFCETRVSQLVAVSAVLVRQFLGS